MLNSDSLFIILKHDKNLILNSETKLSKIWTADYSQMLAEII